MKLIKLLPRLAALLLCLLLLLPVAPAQAGPAGRAVFNTGSSVRSVWTSLAGSRDNVREIRQYTESSVPSGVAARVVSASDSALPIYSWFEDGVLWYWSEDPHPMFNQDASFMFNGFTKATFIDAKPFDTSMATDMEGTFANCNKLEFLDVSGFDTSNVRCMYCMFIYCGSLKTLDVSHFNTTNTTSTSDEGYGSLCGMFLGCASVTELDLSGFDMSRTSWTYHTQNMFPGCTSLERLTLGPKCWFNSYTALSGNWTHEDSGMVRSGSALTSQYTRANALEYSGTWIRDMPEGHYYRTDGSLGGDNLWEVHTPDSRFKGYCLNLNRFGVGEYLDRVSADSDAEIEKLLCPASDGSVHGFAPLGSSMREALITLIYYGWPNDAAGIQRSAGLSDQQYLEVTQNAIWDFTDRYDQPAGPTLYKDSPKMLAAYNQLVSQRFANIPGKWELFLYESWDPSKQNLMSIMGLDDQGYGGVSVKKWNEQGDTALTGAEFTVYDASGNVAGVMVTGPNGEAFLCRTDHYAGLPLGKYTVKETQAPAGYLPDDTVFAFEIREPNVIVTMGYRVLPDGQGPSEEMYFYNKEDKDHVGGGIGILKKSDTGKMLTGAEFTVTDSAGNVVAELVTNSAGIARTGERDLPLGTYTVTETKAPAGYKLASPASRTVSITENFQFLTLEFEDTGKKGSVTLQAKKKLEYPGRTLQEGDFTFNLYDAYDVLLQTKTNDAAGNVVFDTIEYTADDLGFKNYRVEEVLGDEPGMHYDPHPEKITVTIYDTGADTLSCTVIYDDGDMEFVNRESDNRYDVQFFKKKLHVDENVWGALLELRDVSGRVLANWVSAGTPQTINLEAGSYILAETSAPRLYDLADPVPFTLESDGTLVCDVPEALDGKTLSVTARDRRLSSTSLHFRKVDETTGAGLSGGLFLLSGTDPGGAAVRAQAASDASGNVTFEGITTGTYTLQELQPPAGYEPAGPWNVSVTYNYYVSSSPNVNSSGVASGTYGDNIFNRYTVTVPGGPSKIHVDLRWQTEDGFDYLRLRDHDGNYITRDASGNPVGDTDPEHAGYFWGGMDDGRIYARSFDLPGGQVTFEFRSDGGVGAYGYYAQVTTPESDSIVVTDADGKEIQPEQGLYNLPNRKEQSWVFRFTKRWKGGTSSGFTWTLYDPSGKPVKKDFRLVTVTDTEWYYEAEFDVDPEGYYIVEGPLKDYDAEYQNTGAQAHETDRLYNGGTLVNTKHKDVPQTGDRDNPVLWAALGLFALAGFVLVTFSGRRKRDRKK